MNSLVKKLYYTEAMQQPLIASSYMRFYRAVADKGVDSSMLTLHNALLCAYIHQFLSSNGGALSMLEIGTYDGVNARILCEIFANLKIRTLDVNPLSPLLTDVYPDGQSLPTLKRHYYKRIHNCLHPNISYDERGSSSMISCQNDFRHFNLFWVDGDHTLPQVAIDIVNCLSISRHNNKAVILLDDVYLDLDDPTFSTVRNICTSTNIYRCLWFQKRPSGLKGVMAVLRASSPSIFSI